MGPVTSSESDLLRLSWSELGKSGSSPEGPQSCTLTTVRRLRCAFICSVLLLLVYNFSHCLWFWLRHIVQCKSYGLHWIHLMNWACYHSLNKHKTAFNKAFRAEQIWQILGCGGRVNPFGFGPAWHRATCLIDVFFLLRNTFCIMAFPSQRVLPTI